MPRLPGRGIIVSTRRDREALAAAPAPRLDRAATPSRRPSGSSSAAAEAAEAALEVDLRRAGMHVTAASHGGGVAEPLRGRLDGLDELAPRGRRDDRPSPGPQRAKCKHGPGPRPNVLGGEVPARGVAQVRVDVVRGDVCTSPSSSTYWNSSWPGNSWHRLMIAARRRSRRSLSWIAPDFDRKRKLIRLPLTVAWRSRKVVKSERSIQAGVRVVPDADQGELEQAHDGRQDLLAGQPTSSQIRSTWRRSRGRTRPNSIMRSNFADPRRLRHRRDSGTACGRARLDRSPGYGRSAMGRSRRRSRPAGWPARRSAHALPDRESVEPSASR